MQTIEGGAVEGMEVERLVVGQNRWRLVLCQNLEPEEEAMQLQYLQRIAKAVKANLNQNMNLDKEEEKLLIQEQVKE